MSDSLMEQKLREQMQHQFGLKPKSKKRKLPFNESKINNKRSKLSHDGITKSKQEMIAEFKELGLMNKHKPPIPDRNNSWKQQKKRKINSNKNKKYEPNKRRKMNNDNNINIERLHHV